MNSSHTDPTVRRAVAADFDVWIDLCEQVADEGLWIGAEAPVDRQRWRAGFDDSLESETHVRFLAELGGVLTGELHVEVHGGRAEFGMMVRDGFRGRGVGSVLMEACLDWARSAGAHKVALSMWPHNAAALALYRKFGFEVEGRLLRHYRRRSGELWDALLLGLVLDHESAGSPHADAAPLRPL